MDPATIVQIVGTVISLGDVVIKCISKLSAMKAQFHDAPLIVTAVIGQLHMVKVVQEQLSLLNLDSLSYDPRYRQLAGHIGNAVDSFSPILHALAQQLDRFEGNDVTEMTTQLRFSFLHVEREMTNLSMLLDRQVNALNLLLQTMQCQTWVQQSHIIDKPESQLILRLAQDCSSSLMGLDDVASFISENTEAISTHFEFDNVLRSTLLYQSAERSHLRQAIRAKRSVQGNTGPTNNLTSPPAKFRQPAQVARFGWSGAALTARLAASTAQFRSPIEPFRAIKSRNAGPPESTTSSDTVDNVQSGAISVGRALSVISARAPSQDSSGDSDGASSSTQSRRPIQPLSNDKIIFTLSNRFWWKVFPLQNAKSHQQVEKPFVEINNKVLLLGASGSGKTTLLRALGYFTEAKQIIRDASYLRTLVWHYILESVRTALEMLEVLESEVDGTARARLLLFDRRSSSDWDPALDPQFAAEVAHAISNIDFYKPSARWSDYELPDNMNYFIKHIHRFAEQAAHGSRPYTGDLLRIQIRTTGIDKTALEYNGSHFHVYDFGGKRSERKKWINGFESTSTVIIPIDTTAYGKRLTEDAIQYTDQMMEQVTIFDSIVNNPWFVDAKFIVLFTKMDLIENRMKQKNVDTFLRQSKVVHDYDWEPPVSTVERYLYHLQKHLKTLIISPEIQKRIRFLPVNLVDIDTHNPAAEIFDAL